MNYGWGGGAKKLLKKILICIVLGVYLGFTRIQFFQHMFLKKTKKEPRDPTNDFQEILPSGVALPKFLGLLN